MKKDDLSQITTLFWSFSAYHMLRTALKTGLFDKIDSRGEISTPEIATIMGWNPKSALSLIRFFISAEFLNAHGNKISLTEKCRKFFVSGNPLFIGNYFSRLDLLHKSYENMESFLIEGKGPAELVNTTKEAFGLTSASENKSILDFAQVLSSTSTLVVERFFSSLQIDPSAHILDIGAGSGVFAKCLIEKGHTGRIDLLDTPSVSRALKNQSNFPRNQVQWLEANLEKWVPEAEIYDTVFLHHVLHEFQESVAGEILKKAVKALKPGGLLSVIGIFADSGADPELSAIFSVNLLMELGSDNTNLIWLQEKAAGLELDQLAVNPLPGNRTGWLARKRPI